jgi:hypothetical protein
MDIELDKPEVGLESNRRVMTSDIDLAPPKHSYVLCQMVSPVVGHDGGPCMTSDVDLAPPKHSYVFCQMVSPVVGHDGGPCTCYDVGG